MASSTDISRSAPTKAGEPYSSALRQIAVMIETDTSSGCSLIRGVANHAERRGDWHLVLDPRDHEQRSALPDGWAGDGIIARLTSRLQIEQALARKIPIVNVDDLFEQLPGTASVITDEQALSEQALEHLLDRGFRRFAYFAPPSNQYSKHRGDAFIAEVESREYECHEYKPGYRVGRKIGWAEQQRRVSRWLKSLPTPIAILSVDAYRGRQLAEICHLTGIRVPDDVAILAGDAHELMCEVSTPPLSNVNVASERIGYDAALLLDQMIEGNAAPEQPMRVAPRGITHRQSTDLLAIEDPSVVDALRFIRSHAHRGIVVEDILREVPISRRSLEIQFRNYLGRSPAREIRRVQLERSRELLGKRELSITEVAMACGFANATRFGVAFKKETQQTPLAFRKELLAGRKHISGL